MKLAITLGCIMTFLGEMVEKIKKEQEVPVRLIIIWRAMASFGKWKYGPIVARKISMHIMIMSLNTLVKTGAWTVSY